MTQLKELVRPNIWSLAPYSSARNEYSGHKAHVFLDANENPYNKPYNRYPDPLQTDSRIFLGNGSDEAIDLVYRVFCEPGSDNVVAIEPTYGMYKVCADINNVEYRKVLLDDHYQLSAAKLLAACDANTKVVWLCSPNNPTGNNLDRSEIETVVKGSQCIVVIDEAYADFSENRSFRKDLALYPNLIVLNTFSKAWGCAALRLGMAFASAEIMERAKVMKAFAELPICKKVYPSDANFFLALVTDAQAVYDYLVEKGIIVRNRTRVELCNNCLRITIGTKSENIELLSALRQFK